MHERGGAIERTRTPRGGAGRPEGDTLGRYLHQIGRVERIGPRQEAALGAEMHEARRRLRRVLRALPADCRREVTRGLDATLRDASARDIARAVERLVAYRGPAAPPALAALAREACRARRRLERARETLIVANLRLVVHVAKQLSGHGVPLLDLVQEGNIGLMRAVEKYEHQRGHHFSTYAYWWIKQAVGRAVADKGRLIRVPAQVEDQRRRLAGAVTRLSQTLGRGPTTAEVAAATGQPSEEVERLVGLSAEPVPLSGGDRGSASGLLQTLVDPAAPSPEEARVAGELRAAVESTLRTLGPREQLVLRMRFGIGGGAASTLDEIGQRLTLSRERVRQIQQSALLKLRHAPALEPLAAAG